MKKYQTPTTHRIITMLLCIAMFISMVPVIARAAEPEAQAVSGIVISQEITVPEYATAGGSVSQTMEYDCGNGVSGKGEKSYLTIVTGTPSSEFIAYREVLANAGYKLVKENEVASDSKNDPNRFATYKAPDGSYKVYTYHLPFYQETRIIVDTQKDTVAGFSYKPTGESVEPMIVQYGLSMSENGYDNTTTTAYSTNKRNCGALIVIRMPDNSLFIHDGGDLEQWSDEACDRFLKFCRELTGKTNGEKVVINTWFLSHAHSDHHLGMPRFFSKHYDKFDLKYIMYNIDIERTYTTRDIHQLMARIASYYPNVKYYKPHTGDTFNIAGIDFDVIYALEDRYLPNANGELITDYPTIENGKPVTAYDLGGTYREFCYENNGKSDFNDTCTVLRVHMDENTDALLYADMNLAENILFDIYPDSALETDIMMIPHHGFDSHPKLCELSNAKIFLFTQHRGAVYGADGDLNTKDPAGQYRPLVYNNFMDMYPKMNADSIIYWAGNETVCVTVGNETGNLPADMTKADAPAGFTAYTAEAYSFEYEGWSVDYNDGTTVDREWVDGFSEITTNTQVIRFDPVLDETLDINKQYVIVHDLSNHVLLVDAANKITSGQFIGTPAQAEADEVNFYYYTIDNGQRNIYAPLHYRDQALWKMENLESNHEMVKMSTTGYFGEKNTIWQYSMYAKGLDTDANYWYTTAENTDAIRQLQPNNANCAMAKPSTHRVYTEFFSDNTCLIYYYKDDGTKIHVLTCDEDGNWGKITYEKGSKDANIKAVGNDLERLKMRLYYYREFSNATTLSFEGVQEYTLLNTVTKKQTIELITSNIKIEETTRRDLDVPCSGTTPKTSHYYLVFPEGYDASKPGDYVVQAMFRNDDSTDTLVGSVVVHVEDQVPVSGSRLDMAGTVSQNAGVGAVPVIYDSKTGKASPCHIEVTINTPDGHVTRMIPLSVGMLTDGNGDPIDTSIEGTYSGLTITYQGVKLNGTFTLTVTASNDAMNYPLFPEEGSVRVSKQGITTLGDFMNTGVANIQLSATGKPVSNGVDLIVVMDLSGSMENATDTNVDAATYEETRVYAMEQSLKKMVGTLRETGADVRIAMSDFGDLDSHEFEGAIIDKSVPNQPFFDVDFNNKYERSKDYTVDFYEFSNYLNFPMKYGDKDAVAYTIANSKFNLANPSYTGKVVPSIYTGSKEANAEAFVHVDELTDEVMQGIINQLDVDIRKSNGTNYDVGLEYAYHLGMAIQQKNIDEGKDRELVVIFMSDGAPMQYNYFSGRSVSSTWVDWITGNADGITTLSYSKDNKPESMAALEEILMARLKAGKLVMPSYQRDNSGVVDEEKGIGYFKYDANKIDKVYPYFYTYMDLLNFDLDWQYLVDIAKANGIPEFDYTYYQNNTKLPELIEKLTNSELINPYYNSTHYYPQYTGTSTDFFEAMAELDYEISWDMFAKIAYRNRNGKHPENKDLTVMPLLMAVLDEIRNVPEEGFYTLSPYTYFYNPDGLNWWAEAIKGKTTELYPVINKYAYHNSIERPFAYYGDVRNNFSTGTGLPLDGKDYIGGFRGLDADIYSVSFSVANDTLIEAEDANTIMNRIATGPSYFFAANTEEGLTNALKAIVSTISSGASRAWYIDTMGPEFDLSTSKTVIDPNGEEITVNADPMIRVLEFDVDENGYRIGEPNVREVVRFESAPDGSGQVLKAWSDQVYTNVVGDDNKIRKEYTNIWGDDGIIRAKSFYYNTNSVPVRIDLTGDGVPDYPVPAESFLWIIGVIGETEMVLDYEVYLTGSKEGQHEAGLYDTNAHAELQYINYLGNNCKQEVDSPKYPWDKGSVGYSFYLVDKYGNPIINEETGTTGTFEMSVELTDIMYELFELNGQPKTVSAQEMFEKLLETGEMPDGYKLFDPSASYTVTVDPTADPGEVNGTYKVESGVTTNTTWISGLGFDDVLPTPGETKTVTDASTANTIVWFAVCVDVKTNPDVVVIDYGIPVNISVMENDKQFLSKYAKLAAIGAYREPGYTETLESGFGDTFNGTFGSATIIDADTNEAVIRYTLNTTNGMQMNAPEKFTYAVDYNGHYSEEGFYYETITIIPAANIYYEDSFLEFTDTTLEDHAEGMGEWKTAYDTSTITVSCYNAGNWEEVYAYCKGDSGPAGVWPGVKMVDNDHDHIYTASVSADQIGKTVLFNNGEMAYQTSDLPITDNGIYKVNNSWRTNEETTVYFNNADNWNEVSAYWWANGNEVAWPGKAMEVKNGLYSIEVPAGMTNIIFNNNNNGIQTGNLGIVDGGVYQPDGSCTIPTSSSPKTVYFDPQDCPPDTVYAYWWNSSSNNGWPGTEMTLDESTGLYSVTVPGDMTNIIFTNNKQGEAHNLGEQTIEKDGDVYCDLRWEYSTADVEVIFNNTDNWDNVYAYYWSFGNSTMTSWPGIKMIRGENGLYTAEIPVNAENIIFSNGSSLKQTPDLQIGAVGTIYFPDGSQSYDNSAIRTYYFSGDNWDQVYAHAWNDFNDNNGGWPGQKMSYDPVTKLYSVQIKEPNLTYVKFNNEVSETAQLYLPASGSIYHGDNWVSYDGDPIIQEEDRPGSAADALKHIDADNVYGYDPAYSYCHLFSMDSARYVTVDASTGSKSNAPTATFTFTGTGFDVVGLTDNTSGAITVEVKDVNGKIVKNYIVNNFYGMVYVPKQVVDGKIIEAHWKVDTENNDYHLYQVPVMKVEGLDYGIYTVTIRAAYLRSMDKTGDNSYTIWLDAIRIYNPAKGDQDSNNAYTQDGENNAHLTTVKKLLVSLNDLGANNEANGVIFIEGKDSGVTIAEYASQGPNNETYLQPDNGIAFKLRYKGNTAPSINVHLGAKLALGSSATMMYNGNPLATLTTATNMFYDLGSLEWTKKEGYMESKAIVITCDADAGAILSLTDLKVTGTDASKIEGMTSDAALTAMTNEDVYRFARKYMGEQVEVEPVTLAGAGFSLSFEDEVLVNFYYSVSDLTDVTEHGMLVFNTDPGAADIAKADRKYDTPVYAQSGNLYACTTSGIAAKEMGDSRYYCAYAKMSDGTITYSELSQYSPKQYAMSRLVNSNNEELKALCVAMLNYGTAAQQYFGYKTDDLMNAELTDAQNALVIDYSADLFNGVMAADSSMVDRYFTATENGFKRIGSTVSFEGAFALNFYFQLDREDTEVIFYYWTREAYESADELSGSNCTGTISLAGNGNNIFHAPITGIAAKHLDDTVYVAATYTVNGQTFCSGVIAYSISGYCIKQADGNMGDLAQATAMYGYYAERYFD